MRADFSIKNSVLSLSGMKILRNIQRKKGTRKIPFCHESWLCDYPDTTLLLVFPLISYTKN